MNRQIDKTSQGRIKVLYIAGNGRSGSTLIEGILGQINEFVSIGELKHIWRRSLGENQLCGCGNDFLVCDFWRKVLSLSFDAESVFDSDEILKLQRRVDRVRYIPQMLFPVLRTKAYQNDLEAYQKIITKVFEAVHKISGAEVIVDSSKDISTLIFLCICPKIDLFTLHLVRDSRGVAYSWTKKVLRPEITSKDTFMNIHHPIKTAWTWLSWNLFITFMSRIGYIKHSFYLRYEDFIQMPQQMIEKITNFLDLSFVRLDFISGTTVRMHENNHTVSGNPVRFKKGDVNIILDEGWKTKMPFWEKGFVTLISLPLLLLYGYKSSTK